MKKWIEFSIVAVILLLIAVVFAGCEESVANNINVNTQPNIKPLGQHLIPIRDPNWVIAYGDGIESQITYNMIIIRQNQLLIASVMNKAHTTDPNEVIWLSNWEFVPLVETLGLRRDGIVVWKDGK